jgi:hypothetical protein
MKSPRNIPIFIDSWMEHPTEVQFPGGRESRTDVEAVTDTAKILRERHNGESIAVAPQGGLIRLLLGRHWARRRPTRNQ